MPGSGPVYQPTTVSYEQHGPSGYLSQTVSQGLRGARCTQWLLLILGLFSLAAGLIMVIEGAVDIGNKHQHEIDSSNSNLPEGESTDLVILIIGAILMLIGLLMLSYYVRAERRRKNCPCFPSKEQRMARQLRENQAGNGQYAPVSEVAYQPPNLVADEEERRKLMGSDNKDCNEESERMLEPDPRIVLRPLSKVEEA
ncbi:uncharacterized protein LOC117645684 isoform X4 [Thrips palmi]|uniref:Uncharacterized protein LOC117645684 isoform X4 n=1 Tax=Thrips palmi TaxID=161013 RepID=A0A6P8ZN81_THRPL|nr:uncharacterized protein LOC117645684 isoform X4 [Thrips palmi]